MNMSAQDKAKIVAMARLLGATGDDNEIIQRYTEAYENAFSTFSANQPESNKAAAFKSPF